MIASRGAAAAAVLLLSAATGIMAQFAAMPGPTLMPRWYPGGSEGVLARQEVGSCNSGWHNCLNINAGYLCCKNTDYCYVNPLSGNAECCPVGSPCKATDCQFPRFHCNATSTITSGTVTTTSRYEACCTRACQSTSEFKCPTQLGGQCCKYGSECAQSPNGGQAFCRSTISETPSGFVNQVQEGCKTSQFSCAINLGGGCCDNGKSCTLVTSQGASQAMCATASATLPTGFTAAPQDSGGLSTGATAGIAVGIVIVSVIAIGAATWFCLRRRRTRYSSVTQSVAAGGEMAGVPGGGDEDFGRRGTIPVIIGGSDAVGGGGGPRSGSISDVRNPTTDYFGPDAVAGPYTDVAGVETRDTTPGHERGVPMEPHGPGDIVAPVEMGDSDGRLSPKNSVGGRASVASPVPSQLDGRAVAGPRQRIPEDMEGRFELYGSEATPPTIDPKKSP